MIPPQSARTLRSETTGRGRGDTRGRGKARGRGHVQEQESGKEERATDEKSDNKEEECIHDMELVEQDRSLEVIQENEQTGDITIHSGETVRNNNLPETLQTRISLNLYVPPSEDHPDKAIFVAGKKWFAKMLETDKTFKLLPWFDDDLMEDTISSHSDIPTSLSKFKKYFSRARPKVEGGSVYIEVFIIHCLPISEIKADLEWWFKKEKITIYEKAIQAANTARLGWLLFSFSEMNAKGFSRELSARLGHAVSARYKPILTDSWDSTIDNKLRLKAIHLECDKKVEKLIKRRLSVFYSSSSKEFPLGIRMRLVPEFKEIKGNLKIVSKVANLRAKQAHFLKAIVNISSEDILSLDAKTSASPKTLRERIMGIKSWTDGTSTLFHAVNESWDGNRVVFTCTPPNAANAGLIVQALIPYMLYHYGEAIKDFFDPNMLLDKDDWRWDEDTKTLDNPQNRAIDEIEGADLDYDFKDYEESDTQDIATAPFSPGTNTAANLTATHLDRVLAGAEVDSVSTLGNPNTPYKFSHSTIGTSIGSNNSSLSPRSMSGQSIASIDSRVSNIENKINSLEATLTETIKNSMAEVMRNFQPAEESSSGSEL